MKHYDEAQFYDKKKEATVVERALGYKSLANDPSSPRYFDLSVEERLKLHERKAISDYWLDGDLQYLATTVMELRMEVDRLAKLLDDREDRLAKSYDRTFSVLCELHGIEVK